MVNLVVRGLRRWRHPPDPRIKASAPVGINFSGGAAGERRKRARNERFGMPQNANEKQTPVRCRRPTDSPKPRFVPWLCQTVSERFCSVNYL